MSKIVRLHTEGFKRIVVATIAPDGRVVRVTGANEQGKSSLLDSIEAAFRGGRNIPDVPIHKGKKKAVTEVDMGDFTLTRKYTEKGDSLTIELPSGARMQKPQNFMNERLSAISFDPMGFSLASPKDQFDMIRSLVKVEVDFAALKGKNQKDFEARTEINRQAKAYRAQADGITVPEGTPDEPVSVEALVTEMEKAGTHNASIGSLENERREIAAKADKLAGHVQNIAQDIVDLEEEIENLKERIVQRQTEKTEAETEAAKWKHLVDTAPPLPEPIDTSAIQAKVAAAGVTNRAVEQKKRKTELEFQAGAKEKESEGLTESIAARDKERQDAIAAAKMPIPDISFGDEVVLYKGVPLEQASSAVKIKISAAIAMAMQPDIRVMLIRQGSLLDSKALAVIGELAEQYDYQVWVESVDESGKIGFVIEDGRVAGSDEQPEEEKPAPKKEEPKAGSLL